MARYSNSYVNQFELCHLSAFYKYEKKLQRIDADTSVHHLSFGSAAHKAFEVLYKENDVARAQQAMRDYYPVQLDPTDLAKTAENACFTIAQYWKHYDMDKGWEIVAIEEREHTEDNFDVKPDLVVKDTNSNLLIVDHKFTGRYLNYDYFNQFDPNSQVTQYLRWAREKYGAVDGFIVNAIAFRHRQRAYKGEPAGFWCAFERQTYNRTPGQIARTLRSTNEVIEDIERAKSNGHWRANESSNSCRFCSYRQICSAGWEWESDAELITGMYRQVCDLPVSATDEHCQLDLGHEGAHTSAIQLATPTEFTVEV
jgi:hypothetical protein